MLQGPPDSPYSGGLQHGTVKSALARSSPRAITHRPRGRACSVSASAPERKDPRCFGDHGESRGVCWRPAPASRRAEQRRRSLGRYHGKVVFPNEYPFKPPSIYMLTPNGRFETGRRSRSP